MSSFLLSRQPNYHYRTTYCYPHGIPGTNVLAFGWYSAEVILNKKYLGKFDEERTLEKTTDRAAVFGLTKEEPEDIH